MAKKSQYIHDLEPGHTVSDAFVLASADLGQSKNGPYWNLTLQDKSGRINGKIWPPASLEYSSLDSGGFVTVRGRVESYRGENQLKVEQLSFIDTGADPVDPAEFMPCSKVPPEDLMEAIEDLITENMKHTPWKNFCRKVLRDETMRQKLLFAPGAKTVHHAYVGGLLEHTLAVANLCMSICDNYPDLDRQTLLAGAIFHDIGKAWEYTDGPAIDHTDEGRLMGHIQLGLEKVEPFLNRAKALDDGLKLHFRHLITSHHGEHEYGAPVRPKTAEAFVLHHADNLDAKLKIIEQAFEDQPDEPGWSPWLRYLDRNVLKAAPTPSKKTKCNDQPENQCSLPLKG